MLNILINTNVKWTLNLFLDIPQFNLVVIVINMIKILKIVKRNVKIFINRKKRLIEINIYFFKMLKLPF